MLFSFYTGYRKLLCNEKNMSDLIVVVLMPIYTHLYNLMAGEETDYPRKPPSFDE